MEKVEVRDDEGVVTYLKRYRGKLFDPTTPDDFERHLRLLNNADYKEKDVFVTAYPKSGTNWTFEIVNMILRQSTNYFQHIPPFLDSATPSMLKEIFGRANRPGLIANHYHPENFPETALKQNARLVVVYRNPKDVAVSQYHFLRKLIKYKCYKGVSWRNHLKRFLDGNVPVGTWYSFYKEWLDFQKEHPEYPILFLCYEDMKENLEVSVRNIAKFLKIDLEESLILDIAAHCGFEAMFQHKNLHLPPEMHTTTELKENILYRKGEVGDRKNWFTVAQDEDFDVQMNPLIDTLNLDIRYSI